MFHALSNMGSRSDTSSLISNHRSWVQVLAKHRLVHLRRTIGCHIMGCTTSTIERQSADARRAHKVRGIENDYELKTEIGKGSFATVRVCVHKKTQSERAVKVLMTHNEKQKTKAARELDVWKKVGQHENIVVLMDSYISCGVYYFVMQRCNRIISNAFPLCGDTSSYVDFLGGFHQVFLGLQHLQSINVVHRDIKAPNLLVDSDDTVKIGDFGLAIPKEEGGLIGMKGSIPFMSPQMVTGERYGFDTDIWACGALIYSLVFGTYVYDVSSPDTTTLDERKKLMRKAIATDTPKPAPRHCSYGSSYFVGDP